MLTLSTPITEVLYLAKKLEEPLSRVGIKTVSDLLFYFPSRYQDLSQITSLNLLREDETFCVRVILNDIRVRRIPRRRLLLIEADVSDERGGLHVVWFNQQLIVKMLHIGDEIMLSGKVKRKGKKWEMTSPVYEKLSLKRALTGPLHTARIVPDYPLTEGLSQKQLRVLFQSVFDKLEAIEETLPQEILEAEHFISLKDALFQIHFPKNPQTLESARRRLVFEELFRFHLRIQNLKQNLKKSISPSIHFFEEETRTLVQSLSFELTSDQKKAAWTILQDLQNDHPMHRLLNGDVGSGKTVVAALGIFNTAKNGFQTALLCPTEILATQHFTTFSSLFSGLGIRIGLFTRAQHKLFSGEEGIDSQNVSKDDFQSRMKHGKIDVVIGTHALLYEDCKFSKLALAIVDEQHRFGIKQRAWLRMHAGLEKMVPHFLSISATPIPRTLFLSFFGDLDISIIRSLPKNRKIIETKIFSESERGKMYECILEEIRENGSQVFVVCPLISESDKLGVKSVEEEYKRLVTSVGVDNYPPLRMNFLHGRMKSQEKEKILLDFREKKYDLLVTTSVVEVGIDIPNATIMLIEDPQRFGLAQLHQFRGRIGRGEKQGYCFLVSDSEDITQNPRIQAFSQIKDGFLLAQKDLELRGGGDVIGVRQSGLPHFKIARFSDYTLSSKAQSWAKRFK